jgi:hypothetical protein
MGLSTGQVIVITASLAAVGGVTLYFIHHHADGGAPAPKKPGKKAIAKSPAGSHHPAHVQPQQQQQQAPQYTQHAFAPAQPRYAEQRAEQQQQYAYAPQQHAAPMHQQSFEPHVIHARVPPPYSAPAEHHDGGGLLSALTDPVTYTPFPMPQPTPAHEWPRKDPPAPATQAMNPTYWRDLATKMGALVPTAPLMTVRDAQRYLNTLGAAPHGEILDIDNDKGKRTTNALSAFQETHHLPMTGNLDPETGAALLYDVYNLYLAQAGGDVAHAHT